MIVFSFVKQYTPPEGSPFSLAQQVLGALRESENKGQEKQGRGRCHQALPALCGRVQQDESVCMFHNNFYF